MWRQFCLCKQLLSPGSFKTKKLLLFLFSNCGARLRPLQLHYSHASFAFKTVYIIKLDTYRITYHFTSYEVFIIHCTCCWSHFVICRTSRWFLKKIYNMKFNLWASKKLIGWFCQNKFSGYLTSSGKIPKYLILFYKKYSTSYFIGLELHKCWHLRV